MDTYHRRDHTGYETETSRVILHAGPFKNGGITGDKWWKLGIGRRRFMSKRPKLLPVTQAIMGNIWGTD